MIKELEQELRDETGIGKLKIKRNNILGYYIETPKILDVVNFEDLVHTQTLVNATRFKSQKLTNLEGKLQSAEQNMFDEEKRILNEYVDEMLDSISSIRETSRVLAEIDVGSAVAKVASEWNYVCPSVKEEDGLKFDIVEGRHPVVEQSRTSSFVGNPCKLNKEERVQLITGPNMGGKSTYLRQNALISILAQSGCFVPARKATIEVVDQVFSRIGAHDDLSNNRSTFLVEMEETSRILNRATEKSLIIMDEVGRGTSTADGLGKYIVSIF